MCVAIVILRLYDQGVLQPKKAEQGDTPSCAQLYVHLIEKGGTAFTAEDGAPFSALG